MDSERLERSTQALHGMAISLATVVVGAIGMDKASAEIDLGDLARVLLFSSLGFFALACIAGGHLITRLPLIEGSLDEVIGAKVPLIGLGERGLVRISIGAWRAIQHWGLLIAIVLGAAGGLATATAEEMVQAKATAAHAAPAGAPAGAAVR